MSSAWAERVLNIGVLAFRPKAQTIEQWQPLADYLQQKLDHPIQLTPYGYPDFNEAVAQKQVDIIITNPSHYIFLRDRFQVSAPIASIISEEQGSPLKNFGGVIFSRADNTNIECLEDLKGKKIAAVSQDSLGGFQTQVYELYKAQLNQPKPKNILLTGVPHDKTLQAVLDGLADVGFVRSGVLEAMAAEGSLDLKQIKILNAQKYSNFPYLLSTDLYPEWPVAVLPSMDASLQKTIALALLSLADNDSASKTLSMHGFALPEDYSPVETLLRDLRLPPYENLPTVSLQDLWQQYSAVLLISLTLLILVFGAGIGYLLQKHKIIKMQRTLLENEARFMDFFHHNKSVMLLINGVNKMIVDANQSALAFYGYSHKQISQMSIYEINTATQTELAQNLEKALNNQENFFEFTHRLASNTLKNVEVYTSPVTINGQTFLLSIVHDVTEKTQLEKQLQLYASVFTHAKEGILITDANVNIIDVNDTFSQITGYCRKEVVGHNPKILSSGLQPKVFYAKLWQSLKHQGYWTGEIWNRKKNGDNYAELLTISAIKNEQQEVTNYVALFSDITRKKDYENQLKYVASHDQLTGLPNRTLLTENLNHAMSLSLNKKSGLVVLYIDLDGFKAVNDSFGHEVGDELLIIVAGRMKRILRENDTLARIGGDEFVAVLSLLKDVNEAIPLLSRLLNAITHDIHIEPNVMNVSASIGVSFFYNNHADGDLLIRQADQAMYEAKANGKNRYHIFGTEISN